MPKKQKIEVTFMYKWKIFSEQFQNAEHIFPLQQQRVKEMIDYLSQDHNVQCITVFGSSITPACHNESDLDIYVEIKEDKPLIHTYFDFLYDLWTNYTVDKQLLKEIKEKGVVVYQQKSIQ